MSRNRRKPKRRARRPPNQGSLRRKPVLVGDVPVRVVMPVYGQPEFLDACLESMFQHEAGVPYRVTLVDDCGPEADVAALSLLYARHSENVKLVRHTRNQGFAATCNTGARKGKEPLILLLNTDVVILHDGWLKAMVDEFSDPHVGVVGARLSFPPNTNDQARPPGTTQHAGVAFDVLGRPYHIFVGWPIDHPKVNVRREMNCVTGACLMTRRTTWRKLGGLDTDYTKGNFEDVQYCLQVRLMGQKVVYTPKAHLHHFAGGSDNSTTAERNAQLFQLKMGRYVEYDDWRYW